MIKKGIILAGGYGTRLGPLTKAVNKQLLPLYDKPLIYYPLSVLMLAGIKNILIITNKNEKFDFIKLLGDGTQLGMKISFLEQDRPRGLPDAFLVGKNFIGNDDVVLILGDNFFYGQGFTNRLKKTLNQNKGATIFTYVVNNPSDYGILEVDRRNKIKKIIEKPSRPNSNLAITGLYFFNKKVINFAKTLKPSRRNELEIIDLLKIYLKKNKGATIFTYIVNNPSDYGILETDKRNKIKKIIEKPSRPKSNLAITGLYFFNHKVINFAKSLKPSKRNELEIVDLLNIYLKKKLLRAEFMGRGSAWLDTGNATNLFNASQYIAAIEERQWLKIACIEEIAYQNKWVSKKQILKRINFYGKCNYSDYLKKIF